MAGRVLTIIGAAALGSLALPAAADEASNPRARNSLTLAGEDLTFWPLTIAERYYIWRGNETLAGRGIISVSARCRLWSADGLAFEVPGLLPVACAIFDANGTELAEDDPLRRLATRYIQRSLPYLPNDLFEGVDWADYNSVQFAMNLNTGELEPEVDLSSGPLVEKENIPLDARSVQFNYPSGAIRRRARGELGIGCQVQLDLSLICVAETFDPPRLLEEFDEVIPLEALGVKMESQLRDGSPAAGARFKWTIEYQLNRG